MCRWNSDQPVENPSQDLFGRVGFAKRTAKEILAWSHRESLVVGINGEWGSGKTSLANLIEHFIREQAEQDDSDSPVIAHFNPWQWSGQELLYDAGPPRGQVANI